MTPEELQTAVQKAMTQSFRDIGIDSEEWKEVRKDMAWVRTNRVRCESLANRIFAWFAMLFVTGGILAAWTDALAKVKDVIK